VEILGFRLDDGMMDAMFTPKHLVDVLDNTVHAGAFALFPPFYHLPQ
jgi:hypothetical protein